MLMMGFRRIICEPPAAIGASGQRSLSPRTVSAHSRRVLPAVAAQTEKVGPVKRTLPRLLHTRPREGLSLLCRHAPAPASRNPPPPCGALAVSSFACHRCRISTVTDIRAAHDRTRFHISHQTGPAPRCCSGAHDMPSLCSLLLRLPTRNSMGASGTAPGPLWWEMAG